MQDISELLEHIDHLDPEKRRLFEALLEAEGMQDVLQEDHYTPPHTPTEKALAEIWGQALKRERIDIHTHFFELGGDSLLAIQVILQVREVLQVEVPVGRFMEQPTVAAVAAAIDGQNSERARTEDTAAPLPHIIPAPEERFEPFPLTDVQYAYWIGRSGVLELGSVATHSYIEFDQVGLNLERFERAVRRLIERHDMLRAIIQPDGQQRILEHVPPYRVEVLDLRGQEAGAATAHLEAVRERMSHQVLPADRWPLFEIRASLLDNQCVRLHISLDLLLTDAWSSQILSRDLLELYRNPDLSLPALEISFRDYVLAERTLRETELYKRSLVYWRERVATLPPAPDLPLAKDPTSLSEPRFVRRRARIEAAQWQRLKQRAVQAGLTPSAVLATAFADVLAGWSKSPHFTLNLTFFNRLPLHPQVNEVVGDFTSLILLEVDSALQGQFEGRAKRLQKQLWQDLDHRYMSGVEVLRELARRQAGAPRALMPVIFTSTLAHIASIQDASKLEVPDSAVQDGEDILNAENDIYGISQTSQAWLDHQVYEVDRALVFNWDAVEELFPGGLLDDMFESYCALLRRLAQEPPAWLASASPLVRPPANQLALRARINASHAPRSPDLLHSLFARQAARSPDHLALISPQRCLTYQELAHHAALLARCLRDHGARPNQLVAVVMDKGWEQLVATLAILQAGAAYLPIDPELPHERRTYLLQHGQVQLVLTQPWLDQTLTWPEHLTRLCVTEQTALGCAEPLESVQRPDDLAYVIFTSGSTGLPKGVMLDHRAVVNTLLDINERFDVGPADRVLALSSLTFDLSVFDFFGTLAAGATIVLPDAAARRDPAHWLDLLLQHRVTLWNSVPALLDMLLTYLSPRTQPLPASLRQVLLSGDWIALSLPERLWALHPSVALSSLGGATEAAIWSIHYPIHEVQAGWASIPYGTPLRNQSFHVLDSALEPRPVWAVGQLYIGGAGLAQGYWRDAAKTAERFIPNPFAGSEDGGWRMEDGASPSSILHPPSSARLYKTGDLGRYLPDGTIEFLGREDTQVKVQGHRIELGEIEAALALHPAVQANVVLAAGEPRGARRLVAYVVAKERHMSAHEGSVPDQQPLQNPETIVDPVERLQFKLAHRGLRNENGDRPRTQLIKPDIDESLYTARRSYRRFRPEPLTLTQISQVLECLRQVQLRDVPLLKSRYGSAGGLYPVQVYLYIKPGQIDGLAGGTYYYHPHDHELLLLAGDARFGSELYQPINRAIFDAAAFAVFLVGQMRAIAPLYGGWARDFCMLEAGLMTQLLEMSAPQAGIGLCQIGGFEFDAVRDWFALDEGHVYLHSLLGGAIDDSQTRLQALALDSSESRSIIEALQQLGRETGSAQPRAHAASSPRIAAPLNGDGLGEELRRFLAAKLPASMIPAQVVFLDALPLTSNGKVDRRALLERSRAEPAKARVVVAPQTELERAIVAVWQELLEVNEISVHDSFFDLGGNSVLLVKAHNKLSQALGQEIAMVKMFEYPTVETLAAYLSHEQEPSQAALQQSHDRAQPRKALMQRQARRRSR